MQGCAAGVLQDDFAEIVAVFAPIHKDTPKLAGILLNFAIFGLHPVSVRGDGHVAWVT